MKGIIKQLSDIFKIAFVNDNPFFKSWVEENKKKQDQREAEKQQKFLKDLTEKLKSISK